MERRKRKKKNYFKYVLAFIAILLVFVYGYVYHYLNQLSVVGGAEGYPVPKKRVNILIVGIANNLSDTIMLCSFSPEDNKLQMISIPRDTYYPRKGYNNTAQKKINAAYGGGGIEEVVKSVSDLTDVPIHYYVKVDYNAVKSIVNAIGGIEVQIKNNMDYDDPTDNLHIHFKKGETVSSGEDIIKVLRWRKNNKGGGYKEGDLGRIKMQQEVVKLGVEKFLSGNIVLNFLKLQKPLTENIKTNMSPEQMMYYIRKGKNLDIENVDIITVPGTTKSISGLSFFVVDKIKMQEALKDISLEK